MEPPSPSVYSTASSRSALHNRVSMLLSHAPRADIDATATNSPMRATQKLRLTIAPRPSFRALAMRSNSTRPPSSTRSVIDSTAPQIVHTASPTVLSHAAPLTPQERLEVLYASPLTPVYHTWNRTPDEELHTHTQQQLGSGRRTNSKKQWSKLFSPKSFKRHRVRAKAILAVVFGITLLMTVCIYLGLAVSGIGGGLMFHVSFIIFILALTTVFCHCLLTMCLLILKPHPRRVHHVRPTSLTAELSSEKPFPIILAIDEEAALSPDLPTPSPIRPPPPTYGVWRDTKRMDPNLVHWAKLPPSPDTPTYEQALQEIQSTGGHRPPSYVYVDGVLVGETLPVMEGTERDLRHDSTVHPLERERAGMLFGEAR